MKKSYWVLIIAVITIICHGITVNAYSLYSNIEKIVVNETSHMSMRDLCGNYTTVNEKEIQMLYYYIDSLKETAGGGIPSDTNSIHIIMSYRDYDIRCDIYPGSIAIFNADKLGVAEIYKISLKEYYQLCGFINSLILDKFDNDEPISTTPSEWAESDVESMIEAELLSKWHQIGYANKVSRAEVCQLIDDILIAKGIYEDTNIKSVFDDNDDIAVNRLYEEGIVSGISETEFDPYDYITREEFATILSRTYDFLDLSSRPKTFRYADDNDISEWAQDSVNKMYAAGLMQGKDNNEFKPKDTITKQEVIVALRRLADLIEQ